MMVTSRHHWSALSSFVPIWSNRSSTFFSGVSLPFLILSAPHSFPIPNAFEIPLEWLKLYEIHCYYTGKIYIIYTYIDICYLYFIYILSIFYLYIMYILSIYYLMPKVYQRHYQVIPSGREINTWQQKEMSTTSSWKLRNFIEYNK